MQELTSPQAGLSGDGGPGISPDGKWLSFHRATGFRGAWHLYLAPVKLHTVPVAVGEPKRLTDEPLGIRGGAWMPDSSAIVFAWSQGLSSSLWRIPVTGGPPRTVPLVEVGHNAYDPALSLRGSRLAYVDGNSDEDIWRVPLSGPSDQRLPTRLITTTKVETAPSYSPDGKHIAFVSNREGSLQVWVCDSEGKGPKRLTSLAARCGTPRWSPDGKQIAFDTQLKGHSAIYLVGVDGGSPRPLTTGDSDDRVPSWSRDGKWVYFESNRGGALELWKMPAEGGATVQITRNASNSRSAFEARDGHIYYYRHLPTPCVWRAPVAGGEGGKVFDLPKGSWWGSWTYTERGLYFIDPGAAPRPTIECYDFTTGDRTRITEYEKLQPQGVSALSASPDGRWLIFGQRELQTEDVFLVENFR
jgi:Tol biopolymer transport system component